MRNLKGNQLFSASVAALGLAIAAPVFAWDPAAPLSPDTTHAQGLLMRQDGKGRVMVAWEQYDDPAMQFHWTIKPSGGTFGAVTAIDGALPTSFDYDFVATKKGTFTAVWGEWSSGVRVIKTADLTKKDTTFSMPVQISAFGEHKSSPRVAADKKGNTFVAWANESEDGFEVAMRPAKGTFGAPQEFALDQDMYFGPLLQVNEAGDALIAWSTYSGMVPGVFATIRRPEGEFGAVQRVSDPMLSSNYPWPALAPDGSASIFFDVDSTDPDGVSQLGAEQTLFDAPTETEHVFNPIFRYDKKGNLYATWTRSGSPTKVAFAVRPAGSATFGPVSEFGSTYNAYHSDMVVDKKGNIRIVYLQETMDENLVVTTVYKEKKGVFGTPEPLTSESDVCSGPKVTIDKKGTATIAYYKAVEGIGNQIWVTNQPKL